MTTFIKTRNSKYPVSDIKVSESGQITIVAVQPSGKKRYLLRKDVGGARWFAAIECFLAEEVAAAAAVAREEAAAIRAQATEAKAAIKAAAKAVSQVRTEA